MVRSTLSIVGVLVAVIAALASVEAAPGKLPLPAPVAASPSGTWTTPFFQDGNSPGEYTFLSILNTGSTADLVTVSFYSTSGVKITDTSNTIAAGTSWQLFTGTAGGVSATTGGSGWIKIVGTAGSLVPSGFVVLPNEGNYWGFSLLFYTAAGAPPPPPAPTPTATPTATPTLVPASTPQTLVILAAVFLVALYWLGRKARSARA